MQTRYVILFLLLSLRVSFVQAESPDLCKDGILLFREDFGGNDPSDPAISRTPVSGMSSGYTQIYKLQTSDPGRDMGAGSYLVAKRGYRNSSIPTYSVWHVMDDHTYFGDTTRGYLLEIDGKGSGNDVFYSTVIDGLCAGSRLTFSAYVANLTTAGQYNAWRSRNYVHPKLSFVLTHPQTGVELARYNTDTIAHDWTLFSTPSSWKYSANWQLVGMNFTVPEGIDSVRLSIRNNATGSSTGNDFALDDIEIRLCLTPDTIKTDTLVCDTTSRILWRDSLYQIADTLRDTIFNSCGLDSVYYLLSVQTEHCKEPLCTSGILLFREDFGGNDVNDPRVSSTPVPGMSYTQSTYGMGSGTYMVTKSGYCNGDTTGWTIPGADLSAKRSQWYIQDDHTYPNDYTRGYFLEIDGSGGTQQFYQTEISGLCEGIELTFSAYVANVFTWFQYDWYTRNRGPVISPCLKFVLTNPQTGATLAEKNTKEIPFDENLPAKTDWQYSSQWHLVGMNFTVPVGVDAIRLTIYNNVTNGNGNDFAIDDIEIHLCMTPDTIRTDTIVCDTLRSIQWRGKTFAIADTLRDTLRSSCGFDSIYYLMRVETEYCEHPLCTDGILLFREDFGGNNPSDPKISTTPVSGMSYTQVTTDVLGSMGAGKYLVTKQGYCNGNGTSQWHLQDDHTHFGDLTRGYFMEIDGRAGSDAFYRTTIDHLCEGIELTFSAYVANVMTWGMYVGRPGVYAYPRLLFVLTNPQDNSELATYDTGDIPFDSTFIGDNMCWQQSVEWRLVGMNFIVPVGVESVQLSIYNNVSNSNGNDFAIDDIEIHLCMTPDTIRTDTIVCDTISQILWRDSLYQIADTLRDTLLSSCGFDSIYYLLHIETEHCEPPTPPVMEPLCTSGILLFREDFGGNNPEDPQVSTTPVPGIYERYTQVTRTESCMSLSCCNCDDMKEGSYTITKQGYRNSYTADYSIWYIMDDHTYPNDTTRGYFLEVDGKGGNVPLYTTTLNGLCAGLNLSFSSYIANIVTPEQYLSFRTTFKYSYPKLRFVIADPQNGNILAQYTTDTIGHDWSYYNTSDSWKQSANWQLEGMSFVVPEGISQIELSIYNAVNNVRIGNDFAIDDIEIRLCMIPDTVKMDTTVCDTISQILWRDSLYQIADTLRDTLLSSCGFDSIYYLLHIETEHCEPPCPQIQIHTLDTTVCDTLMPFTWHGLLFNEPGSQTIILKDEQGCDSIEIDYTLSTFHCEDFCLEGKLLFREDFGGNDAGDSEISCAHVSGIANFYTNACQEVRKHPEYGMSTMNYVLTKKGQGNRQWHVQDDHTYPNDYTRGYFLEVDGYGGTIYKTTVNNLYEGMELTFSAYIANLHDSCVIANMRKNYGYTYPRFKFILKDAESNAELATYTTGNILPDITTPCVLAKSALWQLKGMKYVVPEGVSSIQMLINNDVASYDGNDFGIDDIEIRLCYMPAKKIVQDTIICDTIDNIVWRNKIYPLKNELRDTVYDSSGADSIYYILNVIMEHCCPEIKEKTITIGTLCDTLLPYTLYFRDTVLTFKKAGDILLEIQHPQWDCIDSIYILHLDTMHCERLYPIIVNKYNWQLLCHNVRVRELFPELTVTGYQWYKDGTAIPNATEDDYSEQNELQGAFQLRLLMSDGRYVWSEILTIQPSQTQAPSRIRIYNHNGYLFYQSEKETTIPSLPRGLYIIQIEQNGEQRIEKKLIP